MCEKVGELVTHHRTCICVCKGRYISYMSLNMYELVTHYRINICRGKVRCITNTSPSIYLCVWKGRWISNTSPSMYVSVCEKVGELVTHHRACICVCKGRYISFTSLNMCELVTHYQINICRGRGSALLTHHRACICRWISNISPSMYVSVCEKGRWISNTSLNMYESVTHYRINICRGKAGCITNTSPSIYLWVKR